MPVVCVVIDERACGVGPGKSRTDERIPVNVDFVVIVNEIVAERLPENDPNQRDESCANRDLNDQRWFSLRRLCTRGVHGGGPSRYGSLAWYRSNSWRNII